MSSEPLERRLASVRWYHRFEIAPGVMTPGHVIFDAAALLDSVGIPSNLAGKRAIDIGTFDGPMAFELERRGAIVIALDVLEPGQTAFNVAKEIVGSRVRHVQGSVYDLTRLFSERFDLVCFLGVFYHLTDPVRAFQQIAEVLAEGGQVFFEGECLRSYAETLSGSGVRNEFVRQIADSEIPLALCCPGEYKHSPNWFIPNFAGLRGWLRVAGLEVVTHSFRELEYDPPHQRVKGLAAKRRPSVAITGVRRLGRTLVVNGAGFSDRSVVNFFYREAGRALNAGGLTPDGDFKMAVNIESERELGFELPEVIDDGEVAVEIANPPYDANERAILKFYFPIESGR
jgi:tRNA (mo5U34)-methyltransferase